MAGVWDVRFWGGGVVLIAWEQENGINGHMNGCDRQLERESGGGHYIFCKKKAGPLQAKDNGAVSVWYQRPGDLQGRTMGFTRKGNVSRQLRDGRGRISINVC